MNGPEWMVVCAYAVTASEPSIVYTSDRKRFRTHQEAVDHGFTLGRSDDFNVAGVDYADNIVWFGWMDKPLDTDRETVAAQLGLRGGGFAYDDRRHIGRSFDGSDLEDACPCPKAPCGLVVEGMVSPLCDQHPDWCTKTLRQGHRPERCASTSPQGGETE